jgi:glycosyltransferase involved in cell wall biosynthesis
MNVLQVNSVCGAGSTGRIAVNLYKVIKEQGHGCKIAYGRGNAPADIDTIKIGTNIDNCLHLINTRAFDRHGLGSVNATRTFIKQIENYNPQIVHLHNLHGYYLNIKLLFEYLISVKKPIVWTLHDCWGFTGHCTNFDYIGCKKWKTGCFQCPQKKEYPASLLFDNSETNYLIKKNLLSSVEKMVIVTPSQWLADLVKQSFLNILPVKIINNGIDLTKFKPAESNFRKTYNLQDKFIVLGAANQWSENKGLNIFVELSKKLGNNIKIVMVGLNEKQKKRLPPQIIGIARTNNEKELAEIYTAADVFVNPTLQDNFPTTNLEALACGTPVITYNTGGSGESIDDTCGIAVEKGNIRELIQAIHFIKANNFDSENCISRAKLYNSDDIFKKYIDIYKEMLYKPQ